MSLLWPRRASGVEISRRVGAGCWAAGCDWRALGAGSGVGDGGVVIIVRDAEDVAIFRMGTSSFLLTRFDRAEHLMMQLMVDDLDAWWARIEALRLEREFGVSEPRPPKVQPWGLRVAFVVDPSGVLWHVAQRRPSVPHDA